MPLLVNSTPVPVTYRDGKSETITIGELSLRNLYVFIKHLGADDTPALVALCAGKPVEWIDTLDDASFDKLSAKCFELNFQRAVARLESDPTAAAKLAPLLMSLARSAKAVAMSGGPGSTSSPAPATAESAAAIGSESSISRQAESSSSSPSSPSSEPNKTS